MEDLTGRSDVAAADLRAADGGTRTAKGGRFGLGVATAPAGGLVAFGLSGHWWPLVVGVLLAVMTPPLAAFWRGFEPTVEELGKRLGRRLSAQWIPRP